MCWSCNVVSPWWVVGVGRGVVRRVRWSSHVRMVRWSGTPSTLTPDYHVPSSFLLHPYWHSSGREIQVSYWVTPVFLFLQIFLSVWLCVYLRSFNIQGLSYTCVVLSSYLYLSSSSFSWCTFHYHLCFQSILGIYTSLEEAVLYCVFQAKSFLKFFLVPSTM